MRIPRLCRLHLIGLCFPALLGCDAPIAHFPSNDLYVAVVAKREAVDTAPTEDLASVQLAVEALFGTPDEPLVPAVVDASLMDLSDLKRAAGAVWSDQKGVQFGLYREHCATCHGVEGSGAGPAAAMLNPYPRDFRAGVFKFKSTARADKPTHSDMVTLLKRGIPGTAMPSFARVSDDDLEAIVQYVRYLSIRGETERRLIDRVITESVRVANVNSLASEIATEVSQSWLEADKRMVSVSPKPTNSTKGNAWWQSEGLVQRGRELFHGPLANCASCHGPSGDGNATTLDFDDWTKEYTTKLGISPSDREAVNKMRSVGALRPRKTVPRKLQWNVYHGDHSDEALYRRLVTGIAGTPMPGLLLRAVAQDDSKSDGNSGAPQVGVSGEDVWAIVAYLRSLAAARVDTEANASESSSVASSPSGVSNE